MSILFEHIILKLMCFLWNSGHFSSHFRTFLVEFCRDRRLRAFFVNSGLFSSHFRTFIVEFCRDRRLRAFPKILKILASSLFSLPCLTIFLTLFEPNSEWHPCSGITCTKNHFHIKQLSLSYVITVNSGEPKRSSSYHLLKMCHTIKKMTLSKLVTQGEPKR